MSFPNLFITEEDIVWIDQNIFENPDKEEDFRKVKFTEAQQDAFKKQEPDWKARFPSEHRWIGQLGEAAFKKYMTVHERELQDFTKNGASWVDFFYPKRTMKIDVKTIGTRFTPRIDYGCNVDEEQDKENREADVYVFCRYVFPEQRIYLLGWIPRDQFSKEAIFRQKDIPITQSFTPIKNFYEISIRHLNTIESIL